jgi:hypothetical protein
VHARVQFCFGWHMQMRSTMTTDKNKDKNRQHNNRQRQPHSTDTETDTESQTGHLFELLTEGMHVPEKFIGLEVLGIFAKVLRQRLKPAPIQLAHSVCSGI